MWVSASSVSRSGDRDLPCEAREPSGTPPRYLLVSIPCASGLNAMQPIPFSPRRVEQATLDPAVEHRVARLVDEQRDAHRREDLGRALGALRGVAGDAGIQGLALLDGGRERTHGLLERGVLVGAVAVEDVDVVQAHPLQALVEAGEQVLAGAADAVGPGPHVVAGLGADDELVAVGLEVGGEVAAEVLLGAAVGRAVVVGEVEVRDADVEGAAQDRALLVERLVVTEVVPQAEGDGGQVQTALAHLAVGHGAVAVRAGEVGGEPGVDHAPSLSWQAPADHRGMARSHHGRPREGGAEGGTNGIALAPDAG